MNNILLITPPDRIHNQHTDIALIHPSTATKNKMQDFLSDSHKGYNIYIYEPEQKHEHAAAWLLEVVRSAAVIIVDVDNCVPETGKLLSYIISLPNTYWLTAEEKSCYNMLSPNRIWDLDSIRNILGGSIEEQE